MPNWCVNTTNVFGKIENAKAFEDAIADRGENDGFIAHLYPCPEELKNNPATFMDLENPVHPNWVNLVADGTWTQEEYDKRAAEAIASAEVSKKNLEKYGFKDWYDWCINNWGTKWGDCDLYIDDGYKYSDDTATLELRYDTAWGPALDALNHISTMFPKLIFYTFYREDGMGFMGYHKVRNGEVLMDDAGEIIFTADDYGFLIDGEDEQEIAGLINE